MTTATVEAPKRKHGIRRALDRHWYAWAMVAPVVIVLAVLVFYPLVNGIWLSLTNTTEANQAAEICRKSLGGGRSAHPTPTRPASSGLGNYADLLSGRVGKFWPQLQITLIWTVGCVFLHYTLGLALAMLLNREFKGRTAYRILLILPWAVPAFVSAFAWKFIFARGQRHPQRGPGGGGYRPDRLVRQHAHRADGRHRGQRLARGAVHDGGRSRWPAVNPSRAV